METWMTIDHTGNTSSASIPIALDELHRAGRASGAETESACLVLVPA